MPIDDEEQRMPMVTSKPAVTTTTTVKKPVVVTSPAPTGTQSLGMTTAGGSTLGNVLKNATSNLGGTSSSSKPATSSASNSSTSNNPVYIAVTGKWYSSQAEANSDLASKGFISLGNGYSMPPEGYKAPAKQSDANVMNSAPGGSGATTPTSAPSTVPTPAPAQSTPLDNQLSARMYLNQTYQGGWDAYVRDQQTRYQQAMASGNTALIQALQQDAQRVGYQLPTVPVQQQQQQQQTQPPTPPMSNGQTPAPAQQPTTQSDIDYIKQQYGSVANYAAGQQQRLNQAMAAGDTATMMRLLADAQRVGYTLNMPTAQSNTPSTTAAPQAPTATQLPAQWNPQQLPTGMYNPTPLPGAPQMQQIPSSNFTPTQVGNAPQLSQAPAAYQYQSLPQASQAPTPYQAQQLPQASQAPTPYQYQKMPDAFDPTSQLNDLYSQLQTANTSALQNELSTKLAAYERQRAGISPAFKQERSTADAQSMQSQKRLAEAMASRGLDKGGENITANVNLQNARQSAMSDIGSRETRAVSDLEQQIADAKNGNAAAISQMVQHVGVEKTKALLNAMQQKDAQNRENIKYDNSQGYQQYQDQVNQQRYQDQINRENTQYQNDMGYRQYQDSLNQQRYNDQINRENAQYENDMGYRQYQDQLNNSRYQDQMNYQQYRDQVGDARYGDQMKYQQQRDNVADTQYNNQQAYQQWRAQVGDTQYANDQRYQQLKDAQDAVKYENQLGYQQYQDAMSRAQYQDQTAYQKYRDQVGDQRYQEQSAWSKDPSNPANYGEYLANQLKSKQLDNYDSQNKLEQELLRAQIGNTNANAYKSSQPSSSSVNAANKQYATSAEQSLYNDVDSMNPNEALQEVQANAAAIRQDIGVDAYNQLISYINNKIKNAPATESDQSSGYSGFGAGIWNWLTGK